MPRDSTPRANPYDYSRPFDPDLWSDHEAVVQFSNSVCNVILDQYASRSLPNGWHPQSETVEKCRSLTKVLLLNLYAAGVADPELYISYSRNKGSYSPRRRSHPSYWSYTVMMKLADWLAGTGFIEHREGFLDRARGISRHSRMRATEWLRRRFEEQGWTRSMIGRRADEEIIILRNNKKKEVDYTDNHEIQAMRNTLRQINECLERHFIDLLIPDSQWPEVRRTAQQQEEREEEPRIIELHRKRLVRIFNNENWEQGGRFYRGWWQNVPKEYRKHIRIDHNPCVEWDFSQIAPTILYARTEARCEGDPYTIGGIDARYRPLLKKAFNSIINASDRNISPPERMGLPEGWEYDRILRAMEERHRPIAQFFYSGEGLTTQYVDSQIAEGVMSHFAQQDIPVLPIHDSFMIAFPHRIELREIMERVFTDQVDLEPAGIGKERPPNSAIWQRAHVAMDNETNDRRLQRALQTMEVVEDYRRDAAQYEGYFERLEEFRSTHPEASLSRLERAMRGIG